MLLVLCSSQVFIAAFVHQNLTKYLLLLNKVCQCLMQVLSPGITMVDSGLNVLRLPLPKGKLFFPYGFIIHSYTVNLTSNKSRVANPY